MYKNENWRTNTQFILTGVIIVSLAGWIAGLLQAIGITINTIHGILTDSAANKEGTTLRMVTLSAQTLTGIGYILYLIGLNRFKSIQKDYDASMMVGRVSTACGFEIAATLLLMLSPFLPFFASWLLRFPAFICTIVSLFLLKSSFEALQEEPTWSKPALKGAAQLRKSAVYNINLIWVPFLAAVVIFLSILMFIQGTELKSLAYSILTGNTKQFQSFAFFIGLEVLTFGIPILYWSIMQFILRILGWVNIHAGRILDAPTQPSVVEETSPQPVTQDILPSHPANETVSPTEDTPDNGEDISQPQSPQKNKTLLYGGITVVVLAIITGIAFLVFSPKDKFSGTWRFDDQFNAAELVLDLKSDSTKGKFYYGSKEEVGFFSIDFTVGSVKVDDHTAELELLYWDDENKQIIIPATVNLRAGDQKMDITVGDENSPELNCGGFDYYFPTAFTLDRIPDKMTTDDTTEESEEDTTTELEAKEESATEPVEKKDEEDYSKPFCGSWEWTDEIIHNDFYDDDLPAAQVTLALDFYHPNTTVLEESTADGWMTVLTTTPHRISTNKITLNEIIGRKAYITVLDGYCEGAEIPVEYQAILTFNPDNKTLVFELGDLVSEYSEDDGYMVGQSPTGDFSHVIMKRK